MLLIKVTLPPLDKYKCFHPANLLSIFSRIGFVYFIPLLVDDIFEICLYGKGKDGMTLSLCHQGSMRTPRGFFFFFDNEKEKGRRKCGASHTCFGTKGIDMQSLCCVRWQTLFCSQWSFYGCSSQNIWKFVMSWGVDLGPYVCWGGMELWTSIENWEMQPAYHCSKW